jgi:hypothetical protein
MAFTNPNKLSGLSPVQLLSGAKYDGKGRMYVIPTSDATNNYFVGDLVTMPGGGDVNGLPLISIATAGAPAVGVIAAIGVNPQGGPYINPANLNLTYAPITKTVPYYCLVHDDPNIIFEIQEGGSSTNLTTSVVQLNANIHAGAGTTNANPNAAGFYLSSQYLDNVTAPTTTSTFNLKIISLAQRPDNHFVTSPTTGGGSQKWWVIINSHWYRAGVTAP